MFSFATGKILAAQGAAFADARQRGELVLDGRGRLEDSLYATLYLQVSGEQIMSTKLITYGTKMIVLCA